MNLRIKSTFKTIISVEFSFLAVIALLGLSESSSCIYMSLASCILHEIGHLLALFSFGVGVKKIVLYGAGIKIVRDFSLVENKKEAVKSGKIAETRYSSYVSMYNNAKQIKEWEL